MSRLLLIAATLTVIALPARAETFVVERVVPEGATLVYTEGGRVVRSLDVPVGRVRVTIEFDAAIQPRHRRDLRRRSQ